MADPGGGGERGYVPEPKVIVVFSVIAKLSTKFYQLFF